ncbi:MAG: hypothetical protein UX22_C0009G0008 [Candidatus Jorgensenbacteria bacterium GW2011_GWA2_45_9]|uniref:Uncharacterized protein n=1 Tax=Candidatus Jorgensenbacteria bacterium GW2011_GWA2_45_9 TaxID=1618663 RepID=A0A0G1N445_9BACT|nr:MAG: hypothetical protein UX22_C0009G0008 [Candidatus Jorgensenbacteria bacterium GW2011_GWA2_45_9]
MKHLIKTPLFVFAILFAVLTLLGLVGSTAAEIDIGLCTVASNMPFSRIMAVEKGLDVAAITQETDVGMRAITDLTASKEADLIIKVMVKNCAGEFAQFAQMAKNEGVGDSGFQFLRI